ncbi:MULTISPECIES: hypothetical protein [Pseudoalteromonas]|uniref:Uncharacterized protein n=1 Tax=Pseudoalteromonas rhizosphaerae TaxID=2518973 RepID=A0ABW8L233_9GAMM|nr:MULTISPECIES: hypothetical protein [unclassified Pseudoalteromonas]MBB1335318.1 hypothetical protein [Pseudoalteromonas sp. SR41-6]MBB1343477.1 hypothetical protein [Pseudoalteromonas sp. SR45-6]MBB1419207.1 hypothetical protein [Pseudoalteromonas sp. SG44-1]MBB1436040.1 hypothetical protein [Pseudoalteromonas sp. SG43-6]MBB1460778.1 hypothetical protein [Pseudoalteromonas sp. SG41-8]
MDRKERPLLEIIARDMKKGYWKAADAARYAPMLFPQVEPSDHVRKAVAAIALQQSRAEQLKALQALVIKERSSKDFLKEFETLLNNKRDRLMPATDQDKDSSHFRDIIMMLLATNFASQKSSVTITADLSDLYQRIYPQQTDEFSTDSSAEAVVTEYIMGALLKLAPDII